MFSLSGHPWDPQAAGDIPLAVSVFLYLPVPLLLFLRPFGVLFSLHVFSLGTPVSVGIWPRLDHHPAVSPPMGVPFPNMGSPESHPSAINCTVCESTTDLEEPPSLCCCGTSLHVNGASILSYKKSMRGGTSLVVQWLKFHAFTAGDMGSTPGQGAEHGSCLIPVSKKKKRERVGRQKV